MNIRDVEYYQGSFWDWSFLNDVFTHNIKVSDIDGVVERNGKFLYIETKRPNKPITTGQDIMHQAWLNQGHTVLRIWGIENKPERATLLHGVAKEEIENCTLEDIKGIVSRWYNWADGHN